MSLEGGYLASRFTLAASALLFLCLQASAATTHEAVLTGWLEVVWADVPENSGIAPPPVFVLTTDDGKSVQLLLDEELLRRAGGILRLMRKRVTVGGTWATRTGARGETSALDVQEIVPQAARARTGGAEGLAGPQPWVSLLCKFSDVVTEPKTLTYFQNMYADFYPGLGHYWREQSFDTVNVTGSGAFGWFVLPQPRSYYVYDSNGDGVVDFDRTAAAEHCIGAADASVNFASYTGINMAFNANLDCCAWGGGRYLTLDGVTRSWMTTWLPPWGYSNIAVISHEMGHGFGLPHSSGMYGATYDNQWDVMSDTWTNCGRSTDPTYGCLGQHTNSRHKDQLGWIPTDRKFVASGGEATVTLEQLALPETANPRMVRIPIAGSATRYYTVEVRRQVGYDYKLPGQGVIIHEVDQARGRPANVVDADGNGNTGDAGAIWTVGEVFEDPETNISVSVDAATATGFTVTVWSNYVTTTTLTPSANPSFAGTSVTFTAAVSNGGTGTVTFKEGEATLGTGTISGGIATWATSSLTTGTHLITAEYGGDATHDGSTATVLQEVVAHALSINDVVVTEGNSGPTNAIFTVSMTSANTQPVTVRYATADGTALGGSTSAAGSSLQIPSGGAATPYPSTAVVSGASGTIMRVTLTLEGFTHDYPQDVDVLLVGPGGQSVIVMSDAGSGTSVNGVTLTLDDAAAAPLTFQTLTTGTYQPANVDDGEGVDTFGAPAPAGPYGTALSAFNGTSPNGTWSLYVVDDYTGDAGTLSGWSLSITTTGAWDYAFAGGSLTFSPGSLSQTITVQVNGDASAEGNETFFVNLSQSTNAAIVDGQGQATIANDDGSAAPPANVVAAATGATTVSVTWPAVSGAGSYRVYRTDNGTTYALVGSPAVTPAFTDTTASANKSYLYKVRSVAAAESADSNVDLATTVVFTDPTLTAGSTRGKAVHFTQLLTAVNAVRTLAGLSPIAFTAPTPAPPVSIRRQHVLDLRNGLNAARSTLVLSAVTYVDPVIAAGALIKSAHVMDLRTGVN